MYDENKKKELIFQGDKEVKLNSVHVDFLSVRDVEILTKIGVPEQLSPYLIMETEEDYAGYSLYDRINIFEKYEMEEESFKDLCLIGRLDYGYIVIDRNGVVRIWDIDREELTYVNKDLDTFLDCAYLYHAFIKEVQEKYGEDAYIDNLYQEEDLEDLRDKIEALDEKAANEDSFWEVSIEQSLEELDEED